MARSASPPLALLGVLGVLAALGAGGPPGSAGAEEAARAPEAFYVRMDWGDLGDRLSRLAPVGRAGALWETLAAQALGNPVWGPVLQALNGEESPPDFGEVWLPPPGQRLGDARRWYSAFVGGAGQGVGTRDAPRVLERQGPGSGPARVAGPFVVGLLPHRSDADAALALALTRAGGPDPSRVPGMLWSPLLEPPALRPPGSGMAQRAVPLGVWRLDGVDEAGVRVHFVRWEAIEPLDPLDGPQGARAAGLPAAPPPQPAVPGAPAPAPWLAGAAVLVAAAAAWAWARRRRRAR